MTSYSANDLANVLISNWSLGNTVSITATDTMAEPVFVFGHPKVGGLDYTKLVYVYKVNTPENENQIQHPKWIEYRDVYKIVAEYRVPGTDVTDFDLAESDIQLVCTEIDRIVDLTYNPATTTGPFFTVKLEWSIEDQFTGDQAQLVRVLTVTGISIRPGNTNVVRGYGGVLAFDVTNSQGVNLPASNYIYTEAWDVQLDQGYGVSDENVSFVAGSTVGSGIPIRFRTKFDGFFQAKITANGLDIGSNNTNAINQIWQLYTNNELPKVFLIWTVQSQAGKTMTVSTPMYVTNFRQTHTAENISEFTLQARVRSPSIMTYA